MHFLTVPPMLTECMQVLPSALWASRRSWKGVLLYNSSQPRSGQKSPLTVVVVTKHSPSLYSRLHPKSATVIQQPTKLRGGRSPLTVVVVTKHFSFYTVHRWYTEIGEGFWVCSGLLPHSTLSLSTLAHVLFIVLCFTTAAVQLFDGETIKKECTPSVWKDNE